MVCHYEDCDNFITALWQLCGGVLSGTPQSDREVTRFLQVSLIPHARLCLKTEKIYLINQAIIIFNIKIQD